MSKVGHPLKFATPEDLNNAIDVYFKNTERKEWSVSGLAVALTTSRKVLMEYEDKAEYSNTIKGAKCLIEQEYERRGWEKPSTFAIFALKNMGWRDQVHNDLTSDGQRLLTYLPLNNDATDLATAREAGTSINSNLE